MPATDTPDAPKVDENLLQHDNKVFFKFVTISHPETLTRFTNDVNVMVAQAQKIVELNQRIQSALTTTEKEAVTKLREGELQDFNQKDAVFEKVYGFKMDTVAIRPHFIQNQAIQLMSPVTDEQIAGVLTYIRREWDHEASPVSVDLVKKIRAENKGRTDAWTDGELQKK